MKKQLTAEEILADNMSINTEAHLSKIPHMRKFIIDAMEEYATQSNISLIEEIEGLTQLGLGVIPSNEAERMDLVSLHSYNTAIKDVVKHLKLRQ